MTSARAEVVVLVTHARHVRAAERERFAGRLRDTSRGRPPALETCHRVEAYFVTAAIGEPFAEWLPAGGRLLVGEAAIRHRMSGQLARRLLREPLERLGRDRDGRHERAARDLFGL